MSGSKPAGRLGKRYRIMWDQNHGQESYYNPPMTPEKVAQAHFGFFEGTPVDAYMCALGPDCGYTVSYPSKVPGMEFIVDRLGEGATIGNVGLWRHAENLRQLWELGHDPLELQCREAKRLGVDFWFRLSMNDWHHVDTEGQVYRLMGSRFYEEHPEYLIGREGVAGWPESLQKTMVWFQDYAHSEVRQLRMALAAEACEHYDVDGFAYDFMQCPGYFKCSNPMVPGGYDPMSTAWQNYDLMGYLPRQGNNAISIRVTKRNPRLMKELSIEVTDIELEIRYGYPNGPWCPPPGFIPRT
ncbi:MAG: hypothetical protein O7E52_06040 [Candidatus Poribacteria bacterium]|nr:hypothetical protein [Candidatus Poribacteria bacterium]